jgi:rare lipoprotein A
VADAVASSLPDKGEASVYSDELDRTSTASGATYTHEGFTAALLPRSRLHAVPFGTRLRLTYGGRSAVVEVNDTGDGNRTQHRVLDLSKAAMAALLGVPAKTVTNRTSGVIELEKIEIVPPTTPLGYSKNDLLEPRWLPGGADPTVHLGIGGSAGRARPGT